MVAKNEITGKDIRSKPSSGLYRQNWELIFGNPHLKQQTGEQQRDENDRTLGKDDSTHSSVDYQ